MLDKNLDHHVNNDLIIMLEHKEPYPTLPSLLSMDALLPLTSFATSI